MTWEVGEREVTDLRGVTNWLDALAAKRYVDALAQIETGRQFGGMTDLTRLTGTLADRYSIQRELGAGGMATVYLAEDLKHRRWVAVKVLRPDLAAILGAERFLKEIETTAQLQHPHILPLHDSGAARLPGSPAAELLYYVMPYVEGETLREKIAREKQLSVDETIGLARDIAAALDYAHRQGVIHRDIKPENVLLHDGQALLADFGIAVGVAAAGGTRMTEAGLALGTPRYMSPEQATSEQELTAQSDVYSLGAVVYEMLAGKPPHPGESAQAVLARVMTADPEPLSASRPGVPEHVEAAVHRALARVPADRFRRATDFAEALADPASAPRGRRATNIGVAAAVRRRPALLIAASIVIAAAVGFLVSGRPGDTSTVPTVERLLIVPFANRTGDPAAKVWGQLAADEAVRAVDRLNTITVVPSFNILNELEQISLDQTIPVRELAERTGATHTVTGSFTRVGDAWRFDLELANVSTGELISALAPIEVPTDSLPNLVSRVADAVTGAVAAWRTPSDALIGGLGIERSSPPPNPEAWREWVSAASAFCRDDREGAIEHGERAIALAPEWVPPYLIVLPTYSNLGRARPATLTGRFPELAPSMTAFERALWDAIGAPRQIDRYRAAEELFAMSPQDWYTLAFRALQTGRVERARVAVEAAVYDYGCFADWPWTWRIPATVYHLTDDHEAELRVGLEGLRRFPDHRPLIDAVLRAHAAVGAIGEIEALLNSTRDLPPQVGDPWGRRALVAARELRRHGYDEAAQPIAARAVAWFESNPQYPLDLAAAYHLQGRWDELVSVAESLVSLNPEGPLALGYAGIAYAQLNRPEQLDQIERRLDRLSRGTARGTQVDVARWLHAAVAAAKRDTTAAVQHLQAFFAHDPTIYYNNTGSDWDLRLHDFPAFEPLWDYPQFQSLISGPDRVTEDPR